MFIYESEVRFVFKSEVRFIYKSEVRFVYKSEVRLGLFSKVKNDSGGRQALMQNGSKIHFKAANTYSRLYAPTILSLRYSPNLSNAHLTCQ